MSTTDAEQFLRSRSSDQIMAVLSGEEPGSPLPLVIQDGRVVPRSSMIDAFARGDYARVPTVLGTNRDESKIYMMGDPQYVRTLFGMPRLRDAERYERDAEFDAAVWKADGADELAIEMRRVQGPSVFVYRFDWDEEPTPWGVDLPRLLGAAHGLEIFFVMGKDFWGLEELIASEENAPGREWLSTRMQSYWVQFARTGDPARGTGGDLPRWSAWDHSDADSPRFIVFDTQEDGGIRMSSDYVTADRVAARLLADPRFSEDERCERLRELAETFPRATVPPSRCRPS